jgi:hypothetical protein
MTAPLRWREGGCHCGAVRFAVECPDAVEVEDCNCSICAKTGFLHLIAPKTRFRILRGGDQLTSYRFNTGVAEHLFCRTCGIKPWYIPRSNPDGVDVNVRCLDPGHGLTLTIVAFDGLDWEANAAALAHKSKD